MKLELKDIEANMVYTALEFYMMENDSLNADIIIDIMDKIELEFSL